MLCVVERIRSARPIHLRHAISALEEIWNHKRAKIQSIRCLRMSPNHGSPFWIEDSYVLGTNWKIALGSTQTAWAEINRTACRLRLRRFQIRDCNARCATSVDGDEEILL